MAGGLETEGETPTGRVSKGKRGWGVILAWSLVLGFLALVGVSLIRSQEGPVGIGSPVPDFTLTTFQGEQVAMKDLEGKVVVINFWASWCGPCELEAVELEQAYQMMKDRGVLFLGVNYVDTEPEAMEYLAKFGVTYPNGPDLGTRISQAFRIRGVPETFIVGADGRLVSFQKGPYSSLAEITSAVGLALGE